MSPAHPAPVRPATERADTPTRDERPAAVPSLTAAGRPVSDRPGGEAEADPLELIEEIGRLRRRARQQDEALDRLSEALYAVRGERQALYEENRELRLALGATRKSRPQRPDRAVAVPR